MAGVGPWQAATDRAVNEGGKPAIFHVTLVSIVFHRALG